MSARILRFAGEPSHTVTIARACQQAAARSGWNFSFAECLSIYRESKHRELTDAGKAVAREVASQVGIAQRLE